MGNPGKYVGNWTPAHAKALADWKAYCIRAGIDICVRMPGQAVRPSEGIALLQALRFALTKTQGTANPASPPAPTDRDRLRAAMQRAGVDAATLARTLGYGHRSAVADVLRERGPRPLQGKLLAWVEKSERAGGGK